MRLPFASSTLRKPPSRRASRVASTGSIAARQLSGTASAMAVPNPFRSTVDKPKHFGHMAVHLHEEDLPEGVLAPGPVAVDTETMGLVTARDRLCVVQIA